jgi:hypothetical protein
MLDSVFNLRLFSFVKMAIVSGEIASYTTQLLNILTAALGAMIVKFALEATV